MKLKSIDEYNRERMAFISKSNSEKTGIGCPQCGDEMIESNPNMITCYIPPRKAVQCPTCKYSSSIIA